MRRPRHRGFSVLEVIIAFGLFAAVAGAATWALSAVYATAATAAIRADVTEVLTGALDQVALTPDRWDDPAWTVPHPCGEGAGLGDTTCQPVGDTIVEIAYRLLSPGDPDPTCPATSVPALPEAIDHGYVVVRACVVAVTDQRTGAHPVDPATLPSLTRAVPLDAQDLGDQRVVTVSLEGPWQDLGTRPVYLVSAASPTTVRATATVTDGVAHLTLPALDRSENCLINTPCLLALSPTATPTEVGAGPDGPALRVIDAGPVIAHTGARTIVTAVIEVVS